MQSFQRQNLWKYDSEFDNIQLLNSYSNTVLFQPLIQYEEIKTQTVQNKFNFMSAFAGGNQCKNSLRLLSTQFIEQNQRQTETDSQIYFTLFSKNQKNNEKKFSLLPYINGQKKGQKRVLALDQPEKALVVNNKMLVIVEKKTITLYHIHDEHLMLKDFDSVGIGSNFLLVELSHLKYKGKDYLLIFGNQKQDIKPFFKCLVYELTEQKLKFVKKANLFERQTHKPIILYQNYPSSIFQDEQFCLVVGGFEDYEQQHYVFGALQIHLHLLIEQWIDYPIKLTRQVQFNQKHTITSGKAIKVSADIIRDQCWLLFCTEYQTITKLSLCFSQQNDQQFLLNSLQLQTKTLGIRDESIGQISEIYYCQNSIYLLRVPQTHPQHKSAIPYCIYWCDKKMERIRSRPLRDLLSLFSIK